MNSFNTKKLTKSEAAAKTEKIRKKLVERQDERDGNDDGALGFNEFVDWYAATIVDIERFQAVMEKK
eukprot:UN26345